MLSCYLFDYVMFIMLYVYHNLGWKNCLCVVQFFSNQLQQTRQLLIAWWCKNVKSDEDWPIKMFSVLLPETFSP